MNGVMKKAKWFIIATLSILVVGMTLLGIFGFNNSLDYSQSYELKITVNQPLDKAKETLKESVEDYFEKKGISYVSYQKIENGEGYLYIFSEDVADKLEGMQDKINNDFATKINDDVDVDMFVFSKATGTNNINVGMVILALGVGLAAIFIYALIMEKLAGALAVSGSYLLSILIFMALMAITRIPAIPYVEFVGVFAAVLACALSMTTVNRLKVQAKNTDGKIDFDSLALSVIAKEKKKYVLALIAVFVACVALSALFMAYTFYLGAQILVAGVSATAVAYYFTPFVWAAIKAKKKK